MYFCGYGVLRTRVGLGWDLAVKNSWGEGGGMKMGMGSIRGDGCVGLVDGQDERGHRVTAILSHLP